MSTYKHTIKTVILYFSSRDKRALEIPRYGRNRILANHDGLSIES